MIKDIKGFLWIGTQNGLNRFDGNIFKYYFSDKTQRASIASNDIQGLSEDSLHNIWIGTGSGLSRYDMRADTFTNFSSERPIVPFWAKKNEMLCWDYREVAIVSYNINSLGRKIVIRFAPADNLEDWSFKFMYSIFDEAGKSIWILTQQNGLGGLLQVSLTDFRRKYYLWPVSKRNGDGYRHSDAEGMRYDRKRNCIWINSSVGLINFTLDDKQFHHLDPLDQYTNLEKYNRFVGIDLDTKGRVWFATQPKGVIIYNPSDQSVELPFPNDSALQVDAGNFNGYLYCDREGIVWTESWFTSGVYEIAPFSRTVNNYVSIPNTDHSLTDNEVFWFAQGNNGKIWLSTGGGINIFDPASGKFDTLSSLSCIKKNGDNHSRWVSSIDTVFRKVLLEHPGLYEMDLDTKNCQPVIFKDSAGHAINRSANDDNVTYKLRNISITIASYNNRRGVFIIDGDSAVARELLSFPAEEIFPLFVATIDSLLIIPAKTGHLTYVFTDNELIRRPIPLDSIPWGEITYNKADQTYWATSERQLIHFSKDFRVIRRYTSKDGLPQFDMSCLTVDDRNNLWFHTDRSIHQLNPETGEFSQLSEKDGFDKINFATYPGSLKAGNGDIYFPTGVAKEGFVRISPDKFISPPSSVYIETIEVNQHPLSLPTNANNLEQLSLRYFENKITFETGIIDYYAKGKGNIRYKLEADGKTADWQYAPAYYTIRYENLSPAKYKLILQSSNAANEFNGPEKILTINISHAFWNTWWFRLIALAFLIDLIYSFIRWRLKQKYKLQLERSEKERQIADIKQKATELEMQALRAQMNPHFIFNSLSSINLFILQNNSAQASEYLTKFSKLVRMILQNSQASLISLESELESLSLYLDLEAVRFGHRFAYKISYPKDLDIEVLKVPPLIIQPFAENAIWHGLMLKEDKGQLDIDVGEENDYLYIKITDNGIGRKKAAELASKSATKHKSLGLKITRDRIAMLEKTNGSESPVKIIDLEHEDGSAAGTEVIIKMPAIYD